MQLSTINFGVENAGLQLGVANISQTGRKGLQVGVVNISKDSAAHQVGCINIRPDTRIQMLVSGGNANKFNLAVRFKNRYTYTVWGAGAYYLGLDKKISLSGFYRAGVYYPILPKLEISGDIVSSISKPWTTRTKAIRHACMPCSPASIWNTP